MEGTTSKDYGNCLLETVLEANWPTPTARDYKGTNSKEGLTRTDGKTRLDQLPNMVIHGQPDPKNPNTTGKNLELNPDWVEQLMGLPIGWTDLDS